MRSVVIVCVVLFGRVTSADPSPDYYVAAGQAVGVDKAVDWLYEAPQLEGGLRLGDARWLHAKLDRPSRIGYGAFNQGITWVSPQRPHVDVLVGFEWRLCWRFGCFTPGFDAGYRSADALISGAPITASHLGVELGGEHLRVRLVSEVAMSLVESDGGPFPAVGLGLALALAAQW